MTIEVADALEQALPPVVIVVTSPLDVLTEYLTRRWESRPVEVFGTGTSLDAWRLRELLADELGVHPATSTPGSSESTAIRRSTRSRASESGRSRWPSSAGGPDDS